MVNVASIDVHSLLVILPTGDVLSTSRLVNCHVPVIRHALILNVHSVGCANMTQKHVKLHAVSYSLFKTTNLC